ncbi:uncharacterized protein BO96DRAFT_91040 [Aspergillus niger CBS 101883]|uniref:uncharacterized protein n=1 Tax=Aspergillus lacticoffeatus (strain CBS 101883) TaxID=1450533 RepID=UPI000D801A5B|nr:uncharacterized protein BO96DRAFT_91040 [Aspergillus niger CBS 101883]PYH61145.1 hypothetical protein BO96DRAFT_91040 [Aspergillus niger CBS 101883]
MGFQDGPPDRVARSTVDYVMLNSRVWVSQPDTTEPRPVSAPFRLSRMLSSYLPLLCAYTVRRMMISD